MSRRDPPSDAGPVRLRREGRDGVGGAAEPRRPSRLRVATAAVSVGVLAASAALFAADASVDGASSGGYPQRIGFERPSDPLPERPGRLAATVYDNAFGSGRMLGVRADGRFWELPGGQSHLSPSGGVLLTQPWDQPRRLLVHDLVSGERRELSGPSALWLGGWSPDETRLMARVGPPVRPRLQRTAVLDLASGAVTEVAGGWPVGFSSATGVVTVRGGAGSTGRRVVTVTDLATGRTSEIELLPATPWDAEPELPRASVSPDGTTLLLVEGDPDGGRTRDATVRLFSLADGRELTSRRVDDWDGCEPTWLGPDPVLPTTQPRWRASRAAGAALLTSEGARDLVAVHPRLQSTCLQLTPSALEEGPRTRLWGASAAWWTWYWRPVVGAAALLALVALVRLVQAGLSAQRAAQAGQVPKISRV